MALSGLVSFLCKSLFISQSTVNNRGSVASDLVLAKLLSKDNFFAVNSFPILSLGSFEDEALVTVYRDDPVAGATLISHFDVSFTNKVSLSLSGSSNSFNLLEFSFSQPRPTQLSNSWSYSSPNARKDPHVEGVNMFIEPEESAVPEESVEPESVTASQIVKTVALSAKTVEDLFGPESEESEDDGERTQHIEGPNPENEVRLSQIDTSLALSANTIDVILRGGMSGEEEEVARVLFRSMGRPASPLLAILLVHPTRGKVMPPPSLLLH
ncbi:hypothetical protein PC115_g10079 [Phytophthora cactorum]|uniref:Uncharacterized protein n=1 Tax=Phytophthora cactorum TaxID=29920 RepID=A0A8T1CEK1_9STRA|nr:hypothetical protein PC115_g10079 [Phytophthora cactorum]